MSKRKDENHEQVNLKDHYETGHMFGYWAEAPWDLCSSRPPGKKYKTSRGAFRRGIYDGENLRKQHRRRVKEILANPRRMVGDSETLQLLNNELSRNVLMPVIDPSERRLRVAEILVRAGALPGEE